jgi:hypothetical protein
MVLYNFSGIMAANSTLDYLIEVNGLITWFPLMLTIAVFIMLMLSMKTDNMAVLLLVAGFFSTSILSMFWLSGYVPFIYIVFSIVITMLGGLLINFLGD